MSILQSHDGPSLHQVITCLVGQQLVKQAADDAPTPAYDLVGTLYLSNSGSLLLSVPNALVHSIYSALAEPGLELPPSKGSKRYVAHVTVMSPEDLTKIGGGDKVTERGKQYNYTFGRLKSMKPDGWPGIDKVYFIEVYSPELQALRRSYGLSGLPHGGEYAFHISVAVKKRGVTGRNEKAVTRS